MDLGNPLFLKMLHIFGAMMFIGNMIVTAFWKVLSDRTKSIKIVVFSQRVVNITDFIFSSVGIFIILATGLLMSDFITKDFNSVPWMVWGIRLLMASVALWVVVLLPIQAKQALMARQFSDDGVIPDLYWKLGKIWIYCAVVAISLPLANLYFMVFKPMT